MGNQMPKLILQLFISAFAIVAVGCSILDSDDVKFEGITVTNANAEVISIDPNDWCVSEADSLCLPKDSSDTTRGPDVDIRPHCYSFGPAYPNPASDFVKITYSVPSAMNVKFWVEAQTHVEFDSASQAFHAETSSAGVFEIEWNVSEWQSAIYRFHFEGGGIHCIGDVKVE